MKPPTILAEETLVEMLATSARGPRRNAVFATWLLVRICRDLLNQSSIPDRQHRKRLQSFDRRIRSLSLPAPLHRALANASGRLQRDFAAGVPTALNQLASALREPAGPRATEVLQAAAKSPPPDADTWDD